MADRVAGKMDWGSEVILHLSPVDTVGLHSCLRTHPISQSLEESLRSLAVTVYPQGGLGSLTEPLQAYPRPLIKQVLNHDAISQLFRSSCQECHLPWTNQPSEEVWSRELEKLRLLLEDPDTGYLGAFACLLLVGAPHFLMDVINLGWTDGKLRAGLPRSDDELLDWQELFLPLIPMFTMPEMYSGATISNSSAIIPYADKRYPPKQSQSDQPRHSELFSVKLIAGHWSKLDTRDCSGFVSPLSLFIESQRSWSLIN